jgi:hypothetical protein
LSPWARVGVLRINWSTCSLEIERSEEEKSNRNHRRIPKNKQEEKPTKSYQNKKWHVRFPFSRGWIIFHHPPGVRQNRSAKLWKLVVPIFSRNDRRRDRFFTSSSSRYLPASNMRDEEEIWNLLFKDEARLHIHMCGDWYHCLIM